MYYRLTVLLLALVFAVPAGNAEMLCAGLSHGAEGPCACCMDGHDMTTPQDAMKCCAMAELSMRPRGPVKAPVTVTRDVTTWVAAVPITMIDTALASAIDSPVLLVHRGLPSVPIYLQHLSLRI